LIKKVKGSPVNHLHVCLSIAKGQNVKSKLLILTAATALSVCAAGHANATEITFVPNTISATYYYNFTETPGVGITFANPILSDTFSGPISELKDVGGSNTDPNFPTCTPSCGGPTGGGPFGADFTATINVPTSGTYQFGLGSDDAAYLFINGTLVGYEAGPNGFPPAGGTLPDGNGFLLLSFSDTLAAGNYSLEIQYANILCCGQVLELVLPGSVTPIPAALPLFAGGLGVIGLLTRRRRQKIATGRAAA
jgi:hypothetical protein